MKKLILVLFLILNISTFSQWIETKKANQDNMTSIVISDSSSNSSGLIVITTDLDGNLSLIYLANSALENLKNVKSFSNYSYGYSNDEKKYVAIKIIDHGFIFIENSDEEKLKLSLESFDKSNLNKI